MFSECWCLLVRYRRLVATYTNSHANTRPDRTRADSDRLHASLDWQYLQQISGTSIESQWRPANSDRDTRHRPQHRRLLLSTHPATRLSFDNRLRNLVWIDGLYTLIDHNLRLDPRWISVNSRLCVLGGGLIWGKGNLMHFYLFFVLDDFLGVGKFGILEEGGIPPGDNWN